MENIDPGLWAAFEAFAKENPDHPGVRIALELARWVKEQHADMALQAPLQDALPLFGRSEREN
jgi:hypothetical protein